MDLFSNSVFEDVAAVSQQLEETPSIRDSSFVLKRRPGYVTVSLFGRLDALQIQGIDVESLLTDIGVDNCVLDLGGLDFIDSSGVGLLIKIQKHASRQGRACVLCNLPENVRQMLLITKVLPLFRTAKDMDEAEKVLKKSG